MTTVKTGKGEWLFVEVRQNSNEIAVEKYRTNEEFLMWGVKERGEYYRVDLPPGSFTFIGTTKDITEEKAGEIVESVNGWSNVIYHNYTASGRDYRDVVESAFKTATESLQSLLTSQGLDSKLHYAILKKEV